MIPTVVRVEDSRVIADLDIALSTGPIGVHVSGRMEHYPVFRGGPKVQDRAVEAVPCVPAKFRRDLGACQVGRCRRPRGLVARV